MADRTKYQTPARSYMTKDDFPPGQGVTLTIRDVHERTITPKDPSKQAFKRLQVWWVEEGHPPLDLTHSMVSFLVGTFGPDDDQWVRRKVYVYHDETMIDRKGNRGGLALDTPPAPTPKEARGYDLQAELAKTKAALAGRKVDPNDEIPF